MDLTLGPDTPAADLDSDMDAGVSASASAMASNNNLPHEHDREGEGKGKVEPLITARKVRERLASIGTWAGVDGRPLQGTKKLPEQVQHAHFILYKYLYLFLRIIWPRMTPCDQWQ